MKNKDFREIQVSSTLLVVIFLGVLALGVFIFLLGVSVGKKQSAVSSPTQVVTQQIPEPVREPPVKPAPADTEAGAAASEPGPGALRPDPDAAAPKPPAEGDRRRQDAEQEDGRDETLRARRARPLLRPGPRRRRPGPGPGRRGQVPETGLHGRRHRPARGGEELQGPAGRLRDQGPGGRSPEEAERRGGQENGLLDRPVLTQPQDQEGQKTT